MIEDIVDWVDENSTTTLIIGVVLFILIGLIFFKCTTDKPTYSINPREGNCSNIIGIYDESGDIVCSFNSELWFTCTEKIRQPNGKYRPLLGCY